MFYFTTFRVTQVKQERVEVWAIGEKRYLCRGPKYLEILFCRKLSFGKPRLTHLCGILSSRRPLQFSFSWKRYILEHCFLTFTFVYVCVVLATLPATSLGRSKISYYYSMIILFFKAWVSIG